MIEKYDFYNLLLFKITTSNKKYEIDRREKKTLKINWIYDNTNITKKILIKKNWTFKKLLTITQTRHIYYQK